MSEQEKQESQKTIVAFAAGLLIGGLLVWIFGGSPKAEKMEDKSEDQTAKSSEVVGAETKTENATETEVKPEMVVGEGKVTVADQAAAKKVTIGGATFPTDEGWIGVRDYADGKVGYILGVARYSKKQNLTPTEIYLQRSTKVGKEYALVFFSENGDLKFNSVTDKQQEGVVATFKAQ
jgi:hypothetical protein